MITSTANQQVKLLVQLNKKRKLRDERGVFLVEGPKMLQGSGLRKSIFQKASMKSIEKRLPDGFRRKSWIMRFWTTMYSRPSVIPRRPRACSVSCGSRKARLMHF